MPPARSSLLATHDEPHFPLVSGFNLNREEFEFPSGDRRSAQRDGELNLVIVAFQQWQQRQVLTWRPTAQEIEASFPGFIYSALPTIYELPVISRTFINEGIRAGIPDQTACERTVTLYLDKETIKGALNTFICSWSIEMVVFYGVLLESFPPKKLKNWSKR